MANNEYMVDGLFANSIKYKFLWFTIHSKHKLRISPGYFLKNNKKIVLDKPIYKEIFNPKVKTRYNVYIQYCDNKVIDVAFHDKIGNYENHKRIASVYINDRKQIQPFVHFGDKFTWDKPQLEKKISTTLTEEIKDIKKMLNEYRILERKLYAKDNKS